MRQINFIEVGMENYGLYIEPMVLPFNNDSLTLMIGPNGIGKTMALEALAFTLYGMTSKGQRGDDVVNNVVGKNCHTWVKFSLNEDTYRVDRYHKYTKLGNTVILNKNKVDIKKGSREVVPEIDRLIAPRKLFSNTLMFGQKVKDFFTDLVDSDKKEIFRMILDLDIYQLYYKIADTKIKAIKELMIDLETKSKVDINLIEDSQNQITILEKNKIAFESEREKKTKDINTKIEDSIRLIETWKKPLEELKLQNINVKEIEDLKKDASSALDTLEEKQKASSQNLENQKRLKISEIKEKSNQAFKEINDDYYEAKAESDEINQDEINKIGLEDKEFYKKKSEISNLVGSCETEIRMLNLQIDEFEESLNMDDAICPTCLQDMDDECKANLQHNIDSLVEQKSKIETKVKIHNGVIESIENDITKVKNRLVVLIKDYTLEMEKLSQIRESTTNDVNKRLEDALNKVEVIVIEQKEKLESDTKDTAEKLHNTINDLESIHRERQQIADEITEAEETITNLENQMKYQKQSLKDAENLEFDKTQINSYIKRVIDLETKIQENGIKLQKSQRKLTILEFWKKGYSPTGIPSILIDEAIPFMNEKIAEYLEKLTNGRYIVSFDTLDATKGGEFRDKISVHVVDTLTRANSRIQLSGGQTRIIDIATILTLRDLQSNVQDVNFNILIFDEIFDSLDEENIGFVSKVLSQLKIGKSIYLISHRHEDQLEPDEILELR